MPATVELVSVNTAKPEALVLTVPATDPPLPGIFKVTVSLLTGLPLVSVTEAVRVVVVIPLATIELAPVTYTSTFAATSAVKITCYDEEVMAFAVAV